MSQVAKLESGPDPEVAAVIGMRTRLLTLAAACVLGGLALAAGLALHWATLEQRSIEQGALTVARATVHAADREIAAARARLEALATSPALRAGDLRTFYDQLVATPRPEGTWFILWDRERQLLNTLLPFGAPLPRIDDFRATSPAAIRRIFVTRQPLISPVVWANLAQTYIVSVGIPVVFEDEVRHLFDHALSDRRISQVLEEQPLPPGWRSILIDRNRAMIAHAQMVERPAGPAVPEAWTGRLRGPTAEGTFFGDHGGQPVLVAFARSSMSDWTAVVEVPWTGATAPIYRTVRLLAVGGMALAIAAVAVALLAGRGADRPLQALRMSAAQARARQREAETRYRTYWQHTNEALFVLSVAGDGRFAFEGLNPAHERLSGLRSASVAGREPQECLPPEVAAAMIEQCRHCVETSIAVRYEETLDLPAGRRDWETSLAPVRDPSSGRIVQLLGSARDATERKRTEQERDEALGLFRGIAETSPDIIYVLDLGARRALYVNHRVADVLGYGPDEVDDVEDEMLRALFNPSDMAGQGNRLCRLGALADGEVATGEHRLRHRDGGWRWLSSRETVFARDGDRKVTRVLGCAYDITEARRAEEALRGLGGRLLTLQDDERRRIARELHDSTAQLLVGASFAAERIRAALPDLTEEADGAIEETLSLIDESQQEIRTLAYLLHPPLLDEMGLPTALRWYAKGLARRSGLAITVEIDPELADRRLPRDVESALFRIAQEALGNAHRHSGGSQVQVRLAMVAEGSSEHEPGVVLLTVQDDGRGFTGIQTLPTASDSDPTVFGVGLAGMRERMRQLGGQLNVRPAEPRGAVVEASVPIDAGPDVGEEPPALQYSVVDLA